MPNDKKSQAAIEREFDALLEREIIARERKRVESERREKTRRRIAQNKKRTANELRDFRDTARFKKVRGRVVRERRTTSKAIAAFDTKATSRGQRLSFEKYQYDFKNPPNFPLSDENTKRLEDFASRVWSGAGIYQFVAFLSIQENGVKRRYPKTVSDSRKRFGKKADYLRRIDNNFLFAISFVMLKHYQADQGAVKFRGFQIQRVKVLTRTKKRKKRTQKN